MFARARVRVHAARIGRVEWRIDRGEVRDRTGWRTGQGRAAEVQEVKGEAATRKWISNPFPRAVRSPLRVLARDVSACTCALEFGCPGLVCWRSGRWPVAIRLLGCVPYEIMQTRHEMVGQREEARSREGLPPASSPLMNAKMAWVGAVLLCVPPQNVLGGAVDLPGGLCGCLLRRPMGTSLAGVAAAALGLGIWGTRILSYFGLNSLHPSASRMSGVASQGRNGHEAGVQHRGRQNLVGWRWAVGGGRWRRQQVACPRPGIPLIIPIS